MEQETKEKLFFAAFVTVLVTLIFIAIYFAPEPQPEFYVDGIPCRTQKHCDSSESFINFGLHYAYSISSGHYEWVVGSYLDDTCVSYSIDTIKMKVK